MLAANDMLEALTKTTNKISVLFSFNSVLSR